MGVLIEDNDTDYTLDHEAKSCWVQVDNLAIYIVRADEGVSIDVFPVGDEAGESLAGCWALFSEGGES